MKLTTQITITETDGGIGYDVALFGGHGMPERVTSNTGCTSFRQVVADAERVALQMRRRAGAMTDGDGLKLEFVQIPRGTPVGG